MQKLFRKNTFKLLSVVLGFGLLVFFISNFTLSNVSYANNNDSNNNEKQLNPDEINLINAGHLVVAVSPPYPPFIELDGDDLIGFEPDLYKEIGKILNLNIEEKILNFDAIIPAVASGTQCDVAMSGISVNPDRQKTVDFTDSYYNSDLSFVVNEDSSINTANAHFKVYDPTLRFAVQSGSSSEYYVKENFPQSKIVIFPNENDCYSAVYSNQADIVCGTKAVAANLLKSTFGSMRVVMNVATDEEYAIAVSKENPALTNALNSAISKLKTDGTINKLYAKYGISTSSEIVQSDLQTVKCTAKTNSLSSNAVLGGLETAITWEGQSANNEKLSKITFEIPEGMEYSTDYLSVTMLTGDDLLTRVKPKFNVDIKDNLINITFADSSQIVAGGYFRVEIPEVFFDKTGGDFKLSGSYTCNNSITKPIKDIPVITVEALDGYKEFAYNLNNTEPVKMWDSNKFLNLFFNPSLFLLSITSVFIGFLMALATVICAFPLALPFGLLLAFMRISKFKIFRGIASFFVNIVRGTPLFLQIYIAFFGLPLAGIDIPNFLLGLIVLALNSSAYMCEIFRAGIQSISKGQFEASRSLGLNKTKTMIFVILPQAFTRCIPTLTSEFILLFKDTSLLASVGVMEVVMYAKTIVAATGSITPYIVAAVFYLIITIPLSNLVKMIETKIKKGHKVNKIKNQPKKDINVDKYIEKGKEVFPPRMGDKDKDGFNGIEASQLGSF